MKYCIEIAEMRKCVYVCVLLLLLKSVKTKTKKMGHCVATVGCGMPSIAKEQDKPGVPDYLIYPKMSRSPHCLHVW